MKAYVIERYGTPALMEANELPIPEYGADELLIKMLYTSLNAADLDYVHGHVLIRFMGLRKPGFPILGSDCVGRVEACGKNVSGFEPGDIVWGDLSVPLNYATFAEYVTVPAQSVQIVPLGIPLDEAACLPTAAMVAQQNVYIDGGPKPGDKVLVNGAGGGIGTMLVQMLKGQGAKVTAVDRAEKLAMLSDIGADHTLDYLTEDYTRAGDTYDFVYDLVCFRKLKDCLSVVRPGGTFIMLGGSTPNLLRAMAFAKPMSATRKMNIKVGAWETNEQEDLSALGELYLAGTIRPVIDEVIAFDDLISGLERLEAGSVSGKLVLKF